MTSFVTTANSVANSHSERAAIVAIAFKGVCPADIDSVSISISAGNSASI